MSGSRDRSRSPHRPETDAAVWKCGNCTTENPAEGDKCVKCKLTRGSDKSERFADDWECPKCNANNFSRRIDCYKCHNRKPPVDPKHPNDWECLSCKGNNFSKRIDCFKCGEPKPRFVSSAEWECDCGGLNYSRRTDCFKCHRPKPGPGRGQDRGPGQERGQRQTGTYIMTNHGGGGAPVVHNLSQRLRSPTPDRNYRQRSPLRGPYQAHAQAAPKCAPDVDPITGQSEWMCPVCGVSNFYKRFDCYRCFEKKPDGGGIHMQDQRLNDTMYTEHTGQHYDQQHRTTYNTYSVSSNYSNPPDNSYSGGGYRSQQNVESGGGYRPQPNVPLSIPKKRFATDWICQSCLGLNYSKRTDCYKCHDPKPAAGSDSANDTVNVVKKNYVPGRDWDCHQCGGNNFSRRVDCYKCKAVKPEEYKEMDRDAGIVA